MTTETSDLQSDEFTAERMIEERNLILRAIKCPGKTHDLIKNPELRHAFALELNDLRDQAIRGNFRQKLSTDEFLRGIRWGLENTFWSMQKVENRVYVNEGRRVTWHLSELEDHRSPEEHKRYEEFIERVKETHAKALQSEQEILADHQAGKIADLQKYKSLREVWGQETARIKKLQREYGQ